MNQGSILILLFTFASFLIFLSNASLPIVYFVIRSQPNSYHAMKASALERDLEQQAEEINAEIAIIQAHKEWPDDFDKAWALLPIFPELVNSDAVRHDWVMFIEDGTVVNLENLLNTLSKFDSKEELFLARGLFDEDLVIIHHFAQRKAKNGGPFLFPDFEAGWAMSGVTVKRIGEDLADKDVKRDFTIDLKHELAVVFSDEYNLEITNIAEFCGAGEEKPECATNVLKELPVCDDKLSVNDIFVGVKTSLKFHKDRLKVVENTWGPKFKHIVMYSNVTDPKIPTIDCGVPNTERGHCGKTDAILKDFLKRSKAKHYKWLLIADDDTILSVARLIQLLNCYDSDEAVFLGEKYGYGLHTRFGYAYITGGGGMVFSHSAVETWINNCNCPTIDTPDDMYLGQCLYRSGIISTHSPLFHQARPADYAKGYLSNQTPVSFHKHWMVNPTKVYKEWFAEADSALKSYDIKEQSHHDAPTTPPPIMTPEPLPPTPLENPTKDEL